MAPNRRSLEGKRKGGAPSALDLEHRDRAAERLRPFVHDEFNVTLPSGEIAHGPLHTLHTWRPGDLGIRSFHGESWFNAWRTVDEGLHAQIKNLNALSSLGMPLPALESTWDGLVATMRAFYNSAPDSGAYVPVSLAAEKLPNGTYRYATWKDAELVAMERIGVIDPHVIAEATVPDNGHPLRAAAVKTGVRTLKKRRERMTKKLATRR